MFEVLIREAGARFGLGDKAQPLLQMVLAAMTNKDTGGLAGFVEKFKAADLGPVVQSWLGGGPSAQPISNGQLETVLGMPNGLIASLANKLQLGRDNVASALGYLLPTLVGKLTPGGNLPNALPAEIASMAVAGRQLLDSVPQGRTVTRGGAGRALGKWLPWVIVIVLIVIVWAYLSGGMASHEPVTAGANAPAAATSQAPSNGPVAPATSTESGAAPAIQNGATSDAGNAPDSATSSAGTSADSATAPAAAQQ